MKYTVKVDGDYLVRFETEGDYIADTIEIDGDEVKFDSIKEIEDFLAQLLEVAESVVEGADKPIRIKVSTKSGPSKSKKVAEAVEKTEKAVNTAFQDYQRRQREMDEEISRLMVGKLEKEADDEDIIALLVA